MCNKLIIQGRNSKLFLLNFLGELIAYSSPVPDLLGTANVSSDQVYWEEQSDGLLTDEAYGLQDIHLNSILTYGKIKEMGKIDRLSIARPHQSTFYNKLYDHKPLCPESPEIIPLGFQGADICFSNQNCMRNLKLGSK